MLPLMKHTFLRETETKKALCEFIMNSEKLSMGEMCLQFEKAFAQKQECKEAVLFNSGASANMAMLQALKNLGLLQNNDKIGFSALTWATNVMPIIQLGMQPVPVDCSTETLNVMSENLKQTLAQEKIQCLFITNALGFTGDLDEIKKICEAEKILLLEDNCEALGTELFSGKSGNFGMASSFSFFVAHHLSSVEGGMVCTNDETLAEMLRIVRSNGWNRNLNPFQQEKWRKKFQVSEFEDKYTFYDLGFNFRPTEITGFIGISQLQYLDETIEARNKNHFFLEENAKNNPELICIYHKHIKRLSPFAFPVICKTSDIRNKYIEKFSSAGIEVRPMIAGNIQRQPFYKKYVKQERNLAGADFLHNNSFYCGNYPELTTDDLEIISDCILKTKFAVSGL